MRTVMFVSCNIKSMYAILVKVTTNNISREKRKSKATIM